MNRLRVAVVTVFVAVALFGFLGTSSATNVSVDEKIDDSLRDMGEGQTDVVVRFEEPAVGASTVSSMKTEVRKNRGKVSKLAENVQGMEVKNSLWLANAVLVTVDGRESLNNLASIDGVETIHPNFEVQAYDSAGTSDTSYDTGSGQTSAASQAATGSGYSTTSSDYTYGLEQVRAPETWTAFSTRGDGVKVAVLDTGVNVSHPDIELYNEDPGNDTYPGGWAEFYANGTRVQDSEPYDTDGHGTHVSGTVAGGDASGEHIGVAPDAQLMNGLALPYGTGNFAQITSGMEWAVDNDADIISMSLGTNDSTADGLIQPVRNAQSQGTVVIAAVGNNGEGTSGSPGNVYDSISVGASNSNRDIATFSGGETIDTDQAWSNPPGDWPSEYVVPDVAAPGSDVKSADYQGGYTDKFGTSMAAPHVSGVAALMESATDEDLTPTEIRTALQNTAQKPDGWGMPEDERDTRYGYGIVDAKRATESVAETELPADFRITSLSPGNVRVAKGYSLEVSVDITNMGDFSESTPVNLTFNGTPVQNKSEWVSARETESVEFSPKKINITTGNYTYAVSTQNDTQVSNLTVVNSSFDKPLTKRFNGPPTNTGELDPTLYEDLSGDGDGKSVGQTVTVFGELIRGNDLGLTDEQARKLDWNAGSPETEVTVADMVTLFGKQIRS